MIDAAAFVLGIARVQSSFLQRDRLLRIDLVVGHEDRPPTAAVISVHKARRVQGSSRTREVVEDERVGSVTHSDL